MNSVEDQVRAATRAQASALREVRPLRLPPTSAPRLARRPTRPTGSGRWRGWLAPVTAAAVVVALAISLVMIRDSSNGRVVPPTAPTSASVAGVPAYYAAPEPLCKGCGSNRLVVGDTFTGKQLAAFSPPRGTTFAAVSAAADDRTFVAQTEKYPIVSSQQLMWFLLKVTPGASTPARLTRLTRLRIPALPLNSDLGTISLSPSGRELALTYDRFTVPSLTTVVQLYSMATGKLLNSWSTKDPDNEVLTNRESNNQLTWIDGDRALSFLTYSFTGHGAQTIAHAAVRTLNVTAGGGDLIRDSRVVWSQQCPAGTWITATDPQLTADAQTVVSSVGSMWYADPSGKRKAFPLQWLAYQISQPKVARTLYKFTAYTTGKNAEAIPSVQWASASGSTLIVAWFLEGGASQAIHFGLISHGSYIPLPSPQGAPLLSAPGLAFRGSPDVAW